MVNDVTSPEVEELMTAFESMSTVVKFANLSLSSGDLDVAQRTYFEAKILFTKLGNDRGVSIVHNNLGDVFTLQARALAAQAAQEASKAGQQGNNGNNREKAEKLMQQAGKKFDDATKNFRLAIEDAVMLCSAQNQRDDEEKYNEGEIMSVRFQNLGPKGDIEADGGGAGGAATAPGRGGSRATSRVSGNHGHYRHPDDDMSSPAALSLQLANRKLNLALCLAAKGNSAVPLGGSPDLNAINEARRLLNECARLAADREDPKGDQRQVECLLELARLEHQVPGRRAEAEEALNRAQVVVIGYHGSGSHSGSNVAKGVTLGTAVPPPGGLALAAPLAALRQQLLAVRGEHCVANGDPVAAVEHWTDALIGCGDRMDVGAVRASLRGLREQAENRTTFPESLLVALGFKSSQMKKDGRVGTTALVAAVDKALEKLDSEASKYGNVEGRPEAAATRVDLCFVMDCTRSVSQIVEVGRQVGAYPFVGPLRNLTTDHSYIF